MLQNCEACESKGSVRTHHGRADPNTLTRSSCPHWGVSVSGTFTHVPVLCPDGRVTWPQYYSRSRMNGTSSSGLSSKRMACDLYCL